MSENRMPARPRMGMGRGPRGMHSVEKAKDFKGTMAKLLNYLGRYKIAILVMIVFAVGSTLFNIVGPKILGKATTKVFEGVIAKMTGVGGIDFEGLGRILLLLLGLYAVSAVLNFVQGWIMTGISQKISYRMRGELAAKINRMPLDILSREPMARCCRGLRTTWIRWGTA